MRIALFFLIGLSLAGCQTTSQPQVVTREKWRVVTVPPSLYNRCTSVRYPNHETLTDVQVAKLLVALQKSNTECRNSLAAVKDYLDRAARRLSTP